MSAYCTGYRAFCVEQACMVEFGSCMHALNERVRYWLGAMCAWVKRGDGKVGETVGR